MSGVRHDWYQTDQKVVITVLLKNANDKNCKISIESHRVRIEADDNLSLEFELFQTINAQESTYRVSSVKIEISLIKLIGIRWDQLISEPTKPTAATVVAPAAVAQPSIAAATSSVANIFGKDWDKVTKEIEKDVKGEEVVYE